jgi:hypothetical protein
MLFVDETVAFFAVGGAVVAWVEFASVHVAHKVDIFLAERIFLFELIEVVQFFLQLNRFDILFSCICDGDWWRPE